MKTLLSLILLLAPTLLWAFEVQTVNISASRMKASYPATVVLPDSYKITDSRYPVVYLLHGYGGNYKDWLNASDVAHMADSQQVILVMPDGNIGSWYIDSPVKPESNFETYIAKDVTGYIDKHYRSRAEKNARAISGLSMGGFGAFNIAIHHSDLFGAVGSLSGGVDPRPFEGNWQLHEVFGSQQKHLDYWNSRAVINNAPRLRDSKLDIYLDCGVDDFFIGVNRQLRARLLALNIDHHYSERPGGHTWEYWRQAVEPQILLFSQGFKRKLQ